MSIYNFEDKNNLLLNDLLRKKLSSVRFKFWLDYFPCNLAVWRFIEISRPNTLGELNAGFDNGQYFLGKGSQWFTNVLLQNDDYLNAVDSIITDVVTVIAPRNRFRDFLYETEVPELNKEKVKSLGKLVLELVDNSQIIE